MQSSGLRRDENLVGEPAPPPDADPVPPPEEPSPRDLRERDILPTGGLGDDWYTQDPAGKAGDEGLRDEEHRMQDIERPASVLPDDSGERSCAPRCCT